MGNKGGAEKAQIIHRKDEKSICTKRYEELRRIKKNIRRERTPTPRDGIKKVRGSKKGEKVRRGRGRRGQKEGKEVKEGRL
jgi:hypothetical protein